MFILVKSMPLIARPSATNVQGVWTGQDGGIQLHTYVDEFVTDDSDFIKQTFGGGGGSCDLALGFFPNVPVVPAARHEITFRAKYDNSLGGTFTFNAGISSGATPVWSVAGLNVPGGFVTYTFPLTPAQAANISSYSNLRIVFSGSGVGQAEFGVSWVQFRRY